MQSIRRLVITIIVTTALLGGVSVSQAQAPPGEDCRYFSETGHYVCNRFRDFFETRGGLEIFGYPITEAFADATHNDLRVQYFQRARMEEHPQNKPPYDVQLGLLVDELGHIYPGANPDERPAPDDPAHYYFPETEHIVSYAFLDFFRHKGGLDIFGYPRSEIVYEEGRVVQYFQRARMEWHKERAPGQQIVLTKVGERYIERFGIPGDHDEREPPPQRAETTGTAFPRRIHRAFLPLVLVRGEPRSHAPAPVPPSRNTAGLDVSASVRYPITGQTGTQTTFIYVNDGAGRPIAGAKAQVVVHYASGDVTCVTRPTDGAGFTRCSFEIPSPPVGQRVMIDISVTYGGLTATTQTFFMPWW